MITHPILFNCNSAVLCPHEIIQKIVPSIRIHDSILFRKIFERIAAVYIRKIFFKAELQRRCFCIVFSVWNPKDKVHISLYPLYDMIDLITILRQKTKYLIVPMHIFILLICDQCIRKNILFGITPADTLINNNRCLPRSTKNTFSAIRIMNYFFLRKRFSHFSSPRPGRTSEVIHCSSISKTGTFSKSPVSFSSVISVKYRPFRSPSSVPYLNEV